MMSVKMNGEMHCLWRAVDHEGKALESYVAKTRYKEAELKFIKKAGRVEVPYGLSAASLPHLLLVETAPPPTRVAVF